MKILLTGANGFIGRYLMAQLTASGHQMIPAVRRPRDIDAFLPQPAAIAIDLSSDTTPEVWIPRLAGIEAVINCAGILQGRPGRSIAAIHADGPKALFAACARCGIRRVIQISAISAERAAGTAYAATKRDADDFLATLDLDWIVLRPSLVYAEGAYGGTALFRALAALPGVIPMIGRGDFVFQPIHVDDVTATVLRIIETPAITRRVIDPVGPEVLTFRQIIADLRRWLGYRPVPILPLPLPLIHVAARIGDIIGGSINTTALQQTIFGNTGSIEAFIAATGIHPRRWQDALQARPSQSQDRWHARLYFLRPVLRWSLALMWVVSGIVGLLQPATLRNDILALWGFSPAIATGVTWLTCLLDLAIGAALAIRRRPAAITVVQLLVVASYTVGLTVAMPSLWSDPFGPLRKNIPILIAIAILGAIENDR